MKIKICGLMTPQEAQYVNENHVDFAGMVLFFPKSKRNITLEQAGLVLDSLSSTVKSVAVVVSPTLEQIKDIQKTGFDYIQIHGRLPDRIADVITIPVLKAFNVSDLGQYETYHNDPVIAGYVFDAQEAGSGKTFDWSLIDQIPRDEKLLILAGGLCPENVAEAVKRVHPDGVDVSSGVENDNGIGKNLDKIRAFAEACRNVSGAEQK
ncbi:phosphoribosylanthranilate isomerase [Roseburia sp. MUC/MUC-530-WT-4D]|uniref:N-(5'-phosphoribosyl)anthranilate isomerase n=1 Tax=Roseburia porci TaxID=2605790 RepID=A0A6L5YU86_9FIRM|nr:phosphoribosylanthranilate isomerase [Roseburia porci]MST75536.1 phosphoribosylanthranilate isomerase [Roseburia porci]